MYLYFPGDKFSCADFDIDIDKMNQQLKLDFGM